MGELRAEEAEEAVFIHLILSIYETRAAYQVQR